ETLGGFMVTQLSERAVPGDVITAAGHRLTVLEVRDRRIRRIKGVPLPPEELGEDGNAAEMRGDKRHEE
ncbi:MAG TPA: transporter associated domain-containing protein, partial [Polyangia bacterium]|nr:transporter associated domain-containing protein [Polyangia bacterium]